ncbi:MULTISPECIES: phosphate ABC transporter substrate-binding protein PstS [unclassified Cyanobium]|uniref:phosphate ABC transporter substrate-binding protein PstS n=1 Tax=unclassified Cyanobium TaxID=2627006 RepID=UPI0020CDF706|nr:MULTISPECIES: phosphate ABC transporter substrate-binding protein PstS [unclassified Cyanobium]MCP9776510.1 phosphate ABC transporter substrate-binding protein PstS [Cyanobium sp. Tous-M-B4]MCP9876379.1 phosphate ABC transporter substrate-binding protein PstS [Cyanobium sp. A2C-AMD]
MAVSRFRPSILLRGALGLAALISLSSCSNGQTLQAAGASFPAGLYQRWFADLASKDKIRVNYQSVGSGAGVRQFQAGTVDFAASDKPLDAQEAAAIKRGVVQLPLTAGAIAVAYNLPGCKLKLSQEQLVQIFEGKIRNFQQLGCADQAIQVVVRSDGSGTTYNFTNSLAAFSPSWKKGPGVGKSVNWPTGVGAKGNEGVAASLLQTKGSIGYVEAAYVRGVLQAAAIANRAGSFSLPDAANASQALATINLGDDLTGNDPNPSAGYPIVTFTWVLLYKDGNAAKLPALQSTFNYALSEAAQKQAPSLGYIPLPAPVLAKAKNALATIGP